MAAITQEKARGFTHELVDHLDHTLRENTKITPSEVIVGGSLGQGTAVPGEFDIDLVIYTRDITSYDVIGQSSCEPTRSGGLAGYSHLLKRLDEYLNETLQDKYHKTAISRYSIIFVYRGIIEVDLLLSPWWDMPHDFYQFLTTINARIRPRKFPGESKKSLQYISNELDTLFCPARFFTMCANKWQTAFFQHHVDEKTKELVKRAKVWRNKVWSSNPVGFQPKSYTLSLLVVYAHKLAELQFSNSKKHNKEKRIVDRTKKILVRLVYNHRKMNIIWDRHGLSKLLPPYYLRREYKSLLPSRPRILDPANPSSNIYDCGFKDSTPSSYSDAINGKWGWLVVNINTLDLSKCVN